MPSSVASASRRGTATDADLASGAAWQLLLDSLQRAGKILRSDTVPRSPADQTAGYRHLLVLLALGIDEALRASDPYNPRIEPANVDAVLKWGMDCPDAAYVGAGIRGDATYRVSGNRGTVRYLGFQVMGGMESTANVVADDLDIADDGSFELVLSAEPQPGNWMALSEHAGSFVVRQFFYDWDSETPAQLTIECVEGGRSAADRPSSPSAAVIARQLVALGEHLEASLQFWIDIEEAGRAQGLNVFRAPVNRTDMGAAAESVTVWGSWQLEDDEALLVEVVPPKALYWSVALGNYWWETIDYANHQSSLNGHQAVIDDDGVFRAVVAHRDPAVANWLDTGGQRCGPAIFRWVRADGAPVPQTRLVKFAELGKVLPPTTPRVDQAARQTMLDRRRAGVRRRFAR
jgi:hypothetical protein